MSAWEIANQHLDSLVPYEPGKPIEDVARELGLDPSSVIKLASNENPLGPSPKAQEAVIELMGKANIYPDGGGYHLRSAIAKRQGLELGNITLGNGSNEIIELLYHGFTQPGNSSVVASRYAFVVYKLMAQLFNVEFIETPDKALAHDLDALKSAIRKDTRLVFIASPNNPTGLRIRNEELKAFVQSVPKTCLCVLDEAYYEFLENPPESVSWLNQCPNLILLRTFSKIQGLAALRIGYGMASKEITDILQRCRQPFNANALAQTAALAGLQDLEHQERTKTITVKGRNKLQSWCESQKLEYIPSEANFVLMKTGDANGLFKKLLSQGVIIRSMASYGLPDWIRVSIGTPEEMEKFEAVMEPLLAS
ncbi:MAG: histidinol-phosphate transaminase [Verrucomicrobiota bacterium]